MRFGSRSLHNLRTCHPDLVRVLKLALSWGVIDFAVVEGHRGEARQNAAFEAGNSKLRWPDGKHNDFPSRAADLAPWIGGAIPWNDRRYWDVLAGAVLAAAAQLGVELRWGGDWDGDTDLSDQKFNDLGHFELRGR